jgi:hypothetical protein
MGKKAKNLAIKFNGNWEDVIKASVKGNPKPKSKKAKGK